MLSTRRAVALGSSTITRFSTTSLVSTGVALVAIAIAGDVARLSNAEAAAVATGCGFAVSYPLSRRWVFGAGDEVGHSVALLWLGGLSVIGLLLSGAAGATVDLLAATSHLGAGVTLAVEECAESIVLGALFIVRFAVCRVLFAPKA